MCPDSNPAERAAYASGFWYKVADLRRSCNSATVFNVFHIGVNLMFCVVLTPLEEASCLALAVPYCLSVSMAFRARHQSGYPMEKKQLLQQPDLGGPLIVVHRAYL